ncbi:hypothetical protein [Streptomyces sp. NBC_01244]|uniref:hypothetical protein n=1 Tax=Streptomyces sp. NBC_01244 TaxID=2903797 RepID=UPI002E0EDBFF|nr:hypothetical protein OG247_07320 [Streptomyces sp. NBC_01244]
MGDWYQRQIVDPGKQPLLFLLLGFLGAFPFIRLSVRMIRAGHPRRTANAGFALVALGKGKAFTGLLGILVPVFAVVAALRLARPGSPWARTHYPAGGRKAERARVREEREGWQRHLRIRVYDAIAGKPSEP